MKTDPTKRDITKYYEFHRENGHRKDDCIQLKKEIKFLILRGHLRRYVALEDRNEAPPPPPYQPASATPGRDQCDFQGIRRWWGIQFGQEGSPTQH